jgi:hypothetical protein
MKVIIKHNSTLFPELNFRTFEVERIFGDGRAVEIYVPELKRKLDFGLHEVLIVDIAKEFDEIDLDDKEKNSFLRNYVSEILKKDGEYLVCYANVVEIARRESENLLK